MNTQRTFFSGLFFTGILFFITPSFAQQRNAKLTIAVSKTAAESYYTRWLKQIKPDLEIINMYDLSYDSVENVLSRCAGLLLTGGGDVIPSIYGKGKDAGKCEGFDVKRDSMELKLIRTAMKKKMPVLGICRGEQILNVANGGTLFIDIPSEIGKKIEHRNDTMAYHHVVLVEGSLLQKICEVKEGTVTSAHHQCVDKISNHFIVSAKADDGVIEAFELKNKNAYPFMLGVQWHPERMDINNPLSKPIAVYFIKKTEEYNSQKK